MVATSKQVLPFNARIVKAARARDGKLTEYRIAGERGLVLRVMPSGTATYMFTYRIWQGARRRFRKMKLGRRDAMTLHDARKEADEARRIVEAGRDPVAEAEDRKTALTFRDLAEQRLANGMSARRGGFPLAPRTVDDYHKSLTANVYPLIGDMPADEVTGEQIARLLDRIEDRGALVMVDRTRAAIGSCYKWGLKRRMVSQDPTAGLGNRAPDIPRDRIFADSEIRSAWQALDGASCDEKIKIIIKLAFLLGKRRSEIVNARQDGLDLDAEVPTWTLHGVRRARGRLLRGETKNQGTDVVFLPHQAVSLFRQALHLAGPGEWVFPTGSKTAKQPTIHPDSINNTVRRLRQSHEGVFEDASLHVTRHTMATWLSSELSIDDKLIERLLNHTPQDVTRKRYNRGRPGGLMRDALQRWADHVYKVVTTA